MSGKSTRFAEKSIKELVPTGPVRSNLLLITVFIFFISCSANTGDPTAAAIATPTQTIPAQCDRVTPLFSVFDIVAQSDSACSDWLNISYGRAINGTTGSAALWSRSTEYGTGLVVGAAHTLGLGWLGPANTAVPETFSDPAVEVGVPRLFLVRPDGSAIDDLASPWFGLYSPGIASERNNNLLRDLLPREDFYVAVVDSQRLDVSGLPPVVQSIEQEPILLYDPASITTSSRTWAAAEARELVLLLGFPDATGVLTASVGRVLTSGAAGDAVVSLKSSGDEEGDIAYDHEVEILIEGWASAGMSGGAVFNSSGQLVGILVRASGIHDGIQYVRAVRMSHVVERLEAAFEALDGSRQDAVRSYLEVSQ